MEFFETLTKSDNQTIAVLAALVVMLSTAVVLQWRHTANNTVPKWIWNKMIEKVDANMQVLSHISTVINERLR